MSVRGREVGGGEEYFERAHLLVAIVAKHMATMEERREVPADDASLEEVVAAIVVPTAHLLGTDEGRDFLRIMEQLAGWSGVSTGRPNDVLVGTVIGAQLARLHALLAPRLGAALARERAALMVTFLTAALAERARSRENGDRQRLGHERFVEHLVNVLTGALAA